MYIRFRGSLSYFCGGSAGALSPHAPFRQWPVRCVRLAFHDFCRGAVASIGAGFISTLYIFLFVVAKQIALTFFVGLCMMTSKTNRVNEDIEGSNISRIKDINNGFFQSDFQTGGQHIVVPASRKMSFNNRQQRYAKQELHSPSWVSPGP